MTKDQGTAGQDRAAKDPRVAGSNKSALTLPLFSGRLRIDGLNGQAETRTSR